MKNLFFAVAALGLLTGCQTPPTESQRQIIAGLKELNQSLRELNTQLKEQNERELELTMPRADSRRTASPKLLAKIKPLPAQPTDSDISRYIKDIQLASAGQNSFSSTDPQVAMLKKIGPGHFNVVRDYLGKHNFYLNCVLSDLVAPEDKETVRRLLPFYPDLINAVKKQGWANDFKPELLPSLKVHPHPWQFQEITGQLADTPEDRRQLIEIYRTKPGTAFLLEQIRTYPEKVDTAQLVREAWQNQQYIGQSWERQQLALQAAEIGIKDALGQLIADFCSESHYNQEIANRLAFYTGQPANPRTLLHWWQDNRDKLIFDAREMTYRVPPAKSK